MTSISFRMTPFLARRAPTKFTWHPFKHVFGINLHIHMTFCPLPSNVFKCLEVPQPLQSYSASPTHTDFGNYYPCAHHVSACLKLNSNIWAAEFMPEAQWTQFPLNDTTKRSLPAHEWRKQQISIWKEIIASRSRFLSVSDSQNWTERSSAERINAADIPQSASSPTARLQPSIILIPTARETARARAFSETSFTDRTIIITTDQHTHRHRHTSIGSQQAMHPKKNRATEESTRFTQLNPQLLPVYKL